MKLQCDISFEAKYAFITEDEPIEINDYIDECANIDNIHLIKCNQGHELTFAYNKRKKPYFTHINKGDVIGYRTSEWHLEWQSNFPYTEIEFKKQNDIQLKDRRTDVKLNEKYILEIQHSRVERIEVLNRKNDYKLHNKEIIWLINGNDSINITIKENKRQYIEFVCNDWKYSSFMDYEYVFIEIERKIYKVYPNRVQHNMIDVDKPIDKKNFIYYCKNDNDKLTKTIIPPQSTLYIKQQGAGNGKTYGIIQMLDSIEFQHYKYFIIVTKQHSAKTVIYNEFQQQKTDNKLKHLSNITARNESKKYIITYENDQNMHECCNLVIGTIDSLMYSLGDKTNNELSKFESLVNSIINDYILKNVIYGGMRVKLNKEVCLICDETQDLTDNYGKAIINIMKNNYIDAYIVGDKLQSIMNKVNAFTYLIEHAFEGEYIDKKIFPETNICRRFNNKSLIDFVNHVIPFERFKLPHIEPHAPDIELNNAIIIFEGNKIYNNATELKINNEIAKIMEYYNKEVNENDYKPNNFLVVTPFTATNPLVNALETAINVYWNDRYKEDEYKQYAIFHKSETGSSIELTESENATRLVSIHTSKGDGREVVFVIGVDELSLKRFSNESNNLIYISLIHVAITRMKKKLYMRVVNNNDNINRMINEYVCKYGDDTIKVPLSTIEMSNRIKGKSIKQSLYTQDTFVELQQNIINKTQLNDPCFNTSDKKTIDMGHHNIRYSAILIYLYIKIINSETKDTRKQIYAQLSEVSKTDIIESEKWQDHNTNLNKKKISIFKISNNGIEYIEIYEIILEYIQHIKLIIKQILNGKIQYICPYESIILHYMMEVVTNGIYSEISINDLYDITYIYKQSYKQNTKKHDKCICNKLFNNTVKIGTSNNIKMMSTYLLKHYEQIQKIGVIFDNFLQQYQNMNWLINQPIYLNNTNNDYLLHNTLSLLCYNETNIYIVYIKPSFDDLNYNNILIDSIYDTFYLANIHEADGDETSSITLNYKKFNNKLINTIVFSVNNDDYYQIEWKNESNENLIVLNKEIILNIIKQKIYGIYDTQYTNIYTFYKKYKQLLSGDNIDVNKTILKIINMYKKEYDTEKHKKMPVVVLKFFENIQTEVKNKQIILDMYDDKKFFIDTLHAFVINSLNECFDE